MNAPSGNVPFSSTAADGGAERVQLLYEQIKNLLGPHVLYPWYKGYKKGSRICCKNNTDYTILSVLMMGPTRLNPHEWLVGFGHTEIIYVATCMQYIDMPFNRQAKGPILNSPVLVVH